MYASSTKQLTEPPYQAFETSKSALFPALANSSSGLRISGKVRDAETGLDYFGARYMSSPQGRFTSPDPLLESANPSDPQTLNRYTYGLNNPLRFIDPTGMEAISQEECSKNPACVQVQLNVVFDKNANLYDDEGNLLSEYQSQLDSQIAQARDEYGTVGVYFDVAYSQGAVGTNKNGKLVISEGAVGGALNVAVSDSNGVGNINMIGATKMNRDVSNIFLNMSNRGTNSGTLGHEIAHQFGGEVRSRFAGIANAFTVGGANAVMDISNDFRRWQLRGEKAFSQASHWSLFGRYPDPWLRNASSWFGKRR